MDDKTWNAGVLIAFGAAMGAILGALLFAPLAAPEPGVAAQKPWLETYGGALGAGATLLGALAALGAAVWAGRYVAGQLAAMQEQNKRIVEDIEEARKVRSIELHKLVVEYSEKFANELRSAKNQENIIWTEVLLYLQLDNNLLPYDEYDRIKMIFERYRQSIISHVERADQNRQFNDARYAAVDAIDAFTLRLREGRRDPIRPEFNGEPFKGDEFSELISEFRSSQWEYQGVLRTEIEKQRRTAAILLHRAFDRLG